MGCDNTSELSSIIWHRPVFNFNECQSKISVSSSAIVFSSLILAKYCLLINQASGVISKSELREITEIRELRDCDRIRTRKSEYERVVVAGL